MVSQRLRNGLRLGGVSAFTMAVAAVGGLLPEQANADVVVFTNPTGGNHWVWNGSLGHEYLNITLDAASQPNLASTPATYRRLDSQPLASDPGTYIRGSTTSSFLQRVAKEVKPAYVASLVVGVDVGTVIPTPTGPDLSGFSFSGYAYFDEAEPGYPHSAIPEGIPTYLGVRFNLGSGLQYGWIGVVRTGSEVDAFAWGYETQPGVSILAGAGLGVCCATDGSCTMTDASGCSGAWTAGGSCFPSPCASGACCIGEQCFVVSGSTTCTNDGGTYQGDDSACTPAMCDASTPCLGDYNGDDFVDLGDLIAFNTDWQPAIGQSVTPGTSGDFNQDGIVDLADLIAFNTDWQPNIGSTCP